MLKMDFADDGRFSNIFGIVKECGELIEKSFKDFDDGLIVSYIIYRT